MAEVEKKLEEQRTKFAETATKLEAAKADMEEASRKQMEANGSPWATQAVAHEWQDADQDLPSNAEVDPSQRGEWNAILQEAKAAKKAAEDAIAKATDAAKKRRLWR